MKFCCRSDELAKRPNLSFHRKLPDDPGGSASPEQGHDVKTSRNCREAERQTLGSSAVDLIVVVGDELYQILVNRLDLPLSHTPWPE